MENEYVLHPLPPRTNVAVSPAVVSEKSLVSEPSVVQEINFGAWFRRCIATLIVLMVAYIGVVLWSSSGDIAAAILEIPLTALPAVIGLVLVGIALRIIRWHYYVRRMHWHFPVGHSVLAFLASLAFTATPGKAGEAIKLVLLRPRYGIDISSGVGVLFVERLGDVIAVLILSVASLGVVRGVINYLVIVAIAVVAVTLFITSSRIYDPLLARLSRVRRIGGIVQPVARSLGACQQLLRPIPFLIGVGIAVIAWSCEALAFMVLSQRVGIDIGAMQAWSIYGAATLAGVLSALPGGVGGFEAVMVLLLNRLGVPLTAAIPPVIVLRLCTLWFGILIGAVSMTAWFTFVKAKRGGGAAISGEA